MCIKVYPIVCLSAICVQCPKSSEDRVRFPETGIKVFELPSSHWEMNEDPMEE